MIHLVWSGRGWIAPAIAFGASLAMEIVVETVHHDPAYYQNHRWPLATALIMAGTVVGACGLAWGAATERRLVDADTGERVRLTPARHTFFFIPLRWWGAILILLGTLVAMPFMPTAGGT